ncbi:MAG TPA: glycosyltransferase [Microbacteriaceae bacterium]|nr:glycosyltransferase [Microbacteriaceae bacterium]
MPRHVVAVVAAFRPDDGFRERVRVLLEQVESVVIVDDGSGVPPIAEERIDWIAHPTNLGIGAALNTGVARARSLGATHVLTLDQDTLLHPDYVASVSGAFDAATITRAGVAVADVINGVASIPTWHSPEGLPLAPEAIQSGMLVSVDCIDDAGAFDERLFIDSVDREFCHRIRERGWAVVIASGASIEHEIGRLEPLRAGGSYEWHAPFRQYYIARNGVIVARRFRHAEREWSNAMLRATFDEARKLVRNGPRRAKHALASGIGVLHGLVGVGGRIPRTLERLLR